MATDFFERQSSSRRYTKWLVVLFALAVLGILVATFLATMALVEATKDARQAASFDGSPGPQNVWQLPLLVSGGALALIIGGSLFKIAQLRGGGTVVAERVGGRRLYPNASDLVEQRVLNVVEEMALASGVPVPPVYMLSDEQGINAFAAGYSPSDAVVAVTRGCAEQLTRDQLQGVIAHEFSHILNGDMRLNIRLIGVLHGILVIGLIGGMILRSMVYSGHRRSSRDSKGGLPIIALGLGLMIGPEVIRSGNKQVTHALLNNCQAILAEYQTRVGSPVNNYGTIPVDWGIPKSKNAKDSSGTVPAGTVNLAINNATEFQAKSIEQFVYATYKIAAIRTSLYASAAMKNGNTSLLGDLDGNGMLDLKDAWDHKIIYVASNPGGADGFTADDAFPIRSTPYFLSMGPDGKPGNVTQSSSTDDDDNLYSYDAD